MGKRGAGGKKKAPAAPSGSAADDDDLTQLLSQMFTPLPPNKRSELNTIVEKLMSACGGHYPSGSDGPQTPAQFKAEHSEIRAWVEKARALERTGNLNRRLVGPRMAHAEAFLEWMVKNGAEIRGVMIEDFGGDVGIEKLQKPNRGSCYIVDIAVSSLQVSV